MFKTRIAAFYTQSEVDKFYEKIFEDFGKPKIVKYSLVWDSIRVKKWSRNNVIIMIDKSHVNGFDESWTMIGITVEAWYVNFEMFCLFIDPPTFMFVIINCLILLYELKTC